MSAGHYLPLLARMKTHGVTTVLDPSSWKAKPAVDGSWTACGDSHTTYITMKQLMAISGGFPLPKATISELVPLLGVPTSLVQHQSFSTSLIG